MAPVCGVDILVQPVARSWGWGVLPFWLAMRSCAWLDGLECVDVYVPRDIPTRLTIPFSVVININRYQVQ